MDTIQQMPAMPHGVELLAWAAAAALLVVLAVLIWREKR